MKRELKKLHETIQVSIGLCLAMLDGAEGLEAHKLKATLEHLREARIDVEDLLPFEKPPMSTEGKLLMEIAAGIAAEMGVEK